VAGISVPGGKGGTSFGGTIGGLEGGFGPLLPFGSSAIVSWRRYDGPYRSLHRKHQRLFSTSVPGRSARRR
jgi:hypothetical protein